MNFNGWYDPYNYPDYEGAMAAAAKVIKDMYGSQQRWKERAKKAEAKIREMEGGWNAD